MVHTEVTEYIQLQMETVRREIVPINNDAHGGSDLKARTWDYFQYCCREHHKKCEDNSCHSDGLKIAKRKLQIRTIY